VIERKAKKKPSASRRSLLPDELALNGENALGTLQADMLFNPLRKGNRSFKEIGI